MNKYSVCNFGYTGANCTQIVDVCATNPCKNGVCTQSMIKFTQFIFLIYINCKNDLKLNRVITNVVVSVDILVAIVI